MIRLCPSDDRLSLLSSQKSMVDQSSSVQLRFIWHHCKQVLCWHLEGGIHTTSLQVYSPSFIKHLGSFSGYFSSCAAQIDLLIDQLTICTVSFPVCQNNNNIVIFLGCLIARTTSPLPPMCLVHIPLFWNATQPIA